MSVKQASLQLVIGDDNPSFIMIFLLKRISGRNIKTKLLKNIFPKSERRL